MNTADTHLKTINWIFMWIIAGAGFRGTGRTGLENRSCMDYMPLPILFGQSVCMFPMRQVTSVQEAYSLDFISATADSIGKNMQTLAGVSANGFSTEGFYVGFLLLLILVLGVYVAYTGLIKRETTKAIHAIMNFVLVFILSASFIAYAPDYIKKINDFSSDISNASLSLGTKIVMPHSDSQGKDSVDLIRDSLFSIQVQQPWLLLQYNSSDIESIGIDRVESLSPPAQIPTMAKTEKKLLRKKLKTEAIPI